MPTITSLCVKLTADPRGLESGFAQGQAKAQAFGRTVSRIAANTSRALASLPGSGFAGAIAGGVSLATTALQGLVKTLSGIPIVGGLLGAIPTSLAGMLSVIKDGASEMGAMWKMSDRLGVSVEFLSTASLVAGGNVESFEKGLLHLSGMLGRVSAGNQEAINTFTRLGFDAQQLADLGTEDALRVIADKAASLADANQRAQLTMELLTHRGLALAPVLYQGAAGLDALKERAQQTGLYLTAFDAAGVSRAAKAMKEIDLIAKGIQRQFAIEFAPIVGAIAEKFGTWVKSMGGLRGVFKAAAEGAAGFLATMAVGLGKIVEKIEGVLADSKAAADDYKNFKSFISLGFAEDAKGRSIPNLLRRGQQTAGSGPANSAGTLLQDLSKQLLDLPRWFEEAAKSAEKFGASMPNEKLQDATKKLGELHEKLGDAMQAYGLSSNRADLSKLRREIDQAGQPKGQEAVRAAAEAAYQSTLARVEQMEALEKITSRPTQTLGIFDDYRAKVAQLEAALKAGKISAEGMAAGMRKLTEGLDTSVANRAVQLFQETRNPIEQMMGKIDELDEMLDSGSIGWDTYARAVGKATGELEKNSNVNKMTGSVSYGSQEAYKMINQDALTLRNSANPAEAMRESAATQTQILQRIQSRLEELARAVRGGLFKVV